MYVLSICIMGDAYIENIYKAARVLCTKESCIERGVIQS